MKTRASVTLTLVGILCTFAVSGRTQEARTKRDSLTIYVAHLHPMNTKTTGRQTTGEARFR
jgi:hypothetical protein